MATTTDQVLEAARKLGDLIGQHPAATKFRSISDSLKSDAEARRLLDDYARHIDSLRDKEANQQPIEVADKRRLEELQSRIAMHPVLRDLQMAQMDYIDLMRKVDEAIGEGGG